MFVRLTKVMRLRIAKVFALGYMLCVLAPAAAFALGDGSRAAHCLEATNHGIQALQLQTSPSEVAKLHVHGDDAPHAHYSDTAPVQSDGHGKKADKQCCGLACLSALPAAVQAGEMPTLPHAFVRMTKLEDFTGQTPALLYRPPNALLSY